jgi:hypothetical protein
MIKIAKTATIIFFSFVVTSLCVYSTDNSSLYKRGSSISLIDEAFRDGKISKADRAFYRLQAIIAPKDLPDQFKSKVEDFIRCGTPIVREALDNIGLMSPERQSMTLQYLARPSNDKTYISPDSNFLIHYDTAGYEAVPLEDLDFSGVPDYVEKIAIFADSSRRHYVSNLGYLPPPDDGDGLYDIYLLRISAYGLTAAENPGDSGWNDYTSYIQIHCSFDGFPPNDDPDGSVIGAQKVTCAHEYHHAVQLAYDLGESLWWMESSATAFEELVFPQVNDNYYYLPHFYNYPDTFLTSGGYHMYGAFVWALFLAERYYNIDLIRSIWDFCRYSQALAAVDSALLPYGSSMKAAFSDFVSWNYFTGSRSRQDFFDSGAYYPMAPLDRVIDSVPFVTISGNNPPDGLSCNYILAYTNSPVNGCLRVDFDGSNTVEWAFAWIGLENDEVGILSKCAVDVLGRYSGVVYDFQRYDSIVFIPNVVSQWYDDNQYVLASSFIPFGDANASGSVNSLDITYLINFLFKGGAAPVFDYLLGDPNGNGLVNALDITYLINFLYKGGSAPRPYRP